MLTLKKAPSPIVMRCAITFPIKELALRMRYGRWNRMLARTLPRSTTSRGNIRRHLCFAADGDPSSRWADCALNLPVDVKPFRRYHFSLDVQAFGNRGWASGCWQCGWGTRSVGQLGLANFAGLFWPTPGTSGRSRYRSSVSLPVAHAPRRLTHPRLVQRRWSNRP
jgi:hypothetical protein